MSFIIASVQDDELKASRSERVQAFYYMKNMHHDTLILHRRLSGHHFEYIFLHKTMTYVKNKSYKIIL